LTKLIFSLLIFCLIRCSGINNKNQNEISVPAPCSENLSGMEKCNCQIDSAFKISIQKGKCDLIVCEINRTDTTLSVSFYPIYPNNSFPPDSFSWNFGNNETSNVMYPLVLYKIKGIYDVSVRYHFKDGTVQEVIKKNYITL
jgi:hypothetical protein